jgi:hypothetical protein
MKRAGETTNALFLVAVLGAFDSCATGKTIDWWQTGLKSGDRLSPMPALTAGAVPAGRVSIARTHSGSPP